MVGLKLLDMKNTLLGLKSSNIDAQLPTHNDFLQLVITNKMEGEFVDLLEEVKDILERDYLYDDEDDEEMEEGGSFFFEKLKDELPSEALDFNSNSFLYAGYSDCMEEAIRFLIEEENISPEHPIVRNLKAHLEKSKDRILQVYSNSEGNAETWRTRVDGEDSRNELSDMFFETFQSCRDSG